MKTVKWINGVSSMINKTEARKDINELMRDNTFPASRRHFTMLAKNAGLKGWKNAVKAIVKKSDIEIANTNLSTGDCFHLNKTELRRAADLSR